MTTHRLYPIVSDSAFHITLYTVQTINKIIALLQIFSNFYKKSVQIRTVKLYFSDFKNLTFTAFNKALSNEMNSRPNLHIYSTFSSIIIII